jgi:hypothetical protein
MALLTEGRLVSVGIYKHFLTEGGASRSRFYKHGPSRRRELCGLWAADLVCSSGGRPIRRSLHRMECLGANPGFVRACSQAAHTE